MFEEIQEISGVLRLLELSEENPACWIADEHKAGPQYRSDKSRKPRKTGFPLKMLRERPGY